MAIARILPVAKFQAEAWLDSIVSVLHEGLTHIKRSPSQLEALLELIAGCAAAFGPAIEKAISLCLESMFAEGLSSALVKAVDAIASNIPGLAYAARLHLLDVVSMNISGTSFRDFAMPAGSRRASVASLREPRPGHERRRSTSLLLRARARSVSPMRDLVHAHKSEDTVEWDTVNQITALHHLGTVNFGTQPLLLGYFQQQVAPMLSSGDPALRQAALEACCGFFVNGYAPLNNDSLSTAVREIVHAILLVGVADENAQLRIQALRALADGHFQRYLVRAAPLPNLLA